MDIKNATMFSPRAKAGGSFKRRPANALLRQGRGSVVQRKISLSATNESSEPPGDPAIVKLAALPTENFVQRKCADCEEEEAVHRKPLGHTVSNSNAVQNAGKVVSQSTVAEGIEASKGNGKALESETRSFMGRRMGQAFDEVKIHQDSQAAELSNRLNAKAFTVGNDIYFNKGMYKPNDEEGQKLLAHELTHVIQQKGNSSSSHIQRAEIDHRQLTWADFKGAVPDGNIYDAETFSDIRYPDLTTIKPVITKKSTDQDCERGKVKDKTYEATIAMDASGITAKAFMSQEKSWGKALFKDVNEMKKFCAKDSFTIAEIANCKSTIQTATASRDTNCKTVSDSCADFISKSQKFSVDIGGESFEASSTAECQKVVSKCKEIFGRSIKYTSGKGSDISSEGDCATQLNKECLHGRQEAANALLAHEQGHFDITHVLAQKLETELKSVVNAFPVKTVSACGDEAVAKAAKDIATTEVSPKLNDKIKEAQAKVNEVKGHFDSVKNMDVPGKLRSTQDLYDKETTHGSVEAEQAKWKASIGKGKI